MTLAAAASEIDPPADKVLKEIFQMDSTRLICLAIAIVFGAVLFLRRKRKA